MYLTRRRVFSFIAIFGLITFFAIGIPLLLLYGFGGFPDNINLSYQPRIFSTLIIGLTIVSLFFVHLLLKQVIYLRLLIELIEEVLYIIQIYLLFSGQYIIETIGVRLSIDYTNLIYIFIGIPCLNAIRTIYNFKRNKDGLRLQLIILVAILKGKKIKDSRELKKFISKELADNPKKK